MSYINPGWENDNEPYISAENLNDISDALEDATELIGTDSLSTTAQTLTGAVDELVDKIGNTAMTTTATTLTGAIKEVKTTLTSTISAHTAISSATYTFNGKYFYFFRQGNIVTMTSAGDLSTASAGNQTMFTIASQFRPYGGVRVPRANQVSSTQWMFIEISENGVCTLYSSVAITTATNASFTVAYYTANSR